LREQIVNQVSALDILSAVQRVTDAIDEITTATAEQSDSIAQVNCAVVQLDGMTQQNAALVERSHAGVQDPSYEPGPYSEFTEMEVDNFASWYVQRMQAHGY
jgi:hypothetical protein